MGINDELDRRFISIISGAFPDGPPEGNSHPDRNGPGLDIRDGLATMFTKPEVCMVTRCEHCEKKIEVVDFKDMSCPHCGQNYWGE